MIEKMQIKNVGDLKKLLERFDDRTLINFGTNSDGWEIDSYGYDRISLALISSDLEERIYNINEDNED